eukprot:6819326-Pyramimonas_sp.AAC.1
MGILQLPHEDIPQTERLESHIWSSRGSPRRDYLKTTAAMSHQIRHAATWLILQQLIGKIRPVSDVRASAEKS